MTSTWAPGRCTGCGSALPVTAAFCGRCGTPSAAADPPTTPMRFDRPAPPGRIDPRGILVWTTIALLALLAVLGVAAAVHPTSFGLRTPGVAAPAPARSAAVPDLVGP